MGFDIMGFGKPDATTCRWCDRPRKEHQGALGCFACDWMIRWPQPKAAA